MMPVKTVEGSYHFSLKEEEKLARKKNQRRRGKSSVPIKRKGFTHEKTHKSKDDTEKPQNHLER